MSGTVTLADRGENDSVFAYGGMTTVLSSGSLNIGDNELANSSGLTLYSGGAFIVPGTNVGYTLSNKTLHVDASNGGSAVFQGNLAADGAAITFVGDLGSSRSEAMLKVEGDADLSGSTYSVVLT